MGKYDGTNNPERDKFLDKMLGSRPPVGGTGGKSRMTDSEIAASLAEIDNALSGLTTYNDQQRRQLADARSLVTELRYRVGDPSLPPSTPGSYVPPNGPYKSAKDLLKAMRSGHLALKEDGRFEMMDVDKFWGIPRRKR